MNKYIRFITDPAYRFKTLDDRGFYRKTSDKRYLQIAYRAKFGKTLNLVNPQTFNEKLQWLKLYDRKPIYTTMVDKYAVRQYIAERIGEEYLIPLVGGPWKSFDEIDFDALPDQFVLKCTHDSGGVVIVRNKDKMDIAVARDKISRCLARNYYYYGREWPYKDVQPRIIAEKYMEEKKGDALLDYKIFNLGDHYQIIKLYYDRNINLKANIYTTDWERQMIEITEKTDVHRDFPRPKSLKKLLELADKLSDGFSFLRTDFYIVNDRIYFGELTLYPDSGFVLFTPKILDAELGAHISLNQDEV